MLLNLTNNDKWQKPIHFSTAIAYGTSILVAILSSFTSNHVNQIVVQTDSQASIECVVLLSTKAKDRNHTNMNNQQKITRLNCRNGGDCQLGQRESWSGDVLCVWNFHHKNNVYFTVLFTQSHYYLSFTCQLHYTLYKWLHDKMLLFLTQNSRRHVQTLWFMFLRSEIATFILNLQSCKGACSRMVIKIT